MPCRRATPADAATIARIYSEGIEDRIATFETEPRNASDVLDWFERPQPIVVVEEAGNVVAFAASSPSSGRYCYAGNIAASRGLLRRLGFREVGTYERHGQLGSPIPKPEPCQSGSAYSFCVLVTIGVITDHQPDVLRSPRRVSRSVKLRNERNPFGRAQMDLTGLA